MASQCGYLRFDGPGKALLLLDSRGGETVVLARAIVQSYITLYTISYTTNCNINNINIYRSRYAGRFPNLNPLPWLGAYHSSNIPLIFGTHGLLTKYGNSTELEVSVSCAMQDHVVAFAAEPWHWVWQKPQSDTSFSAASRN
jgi:carboxylesterase type B